MPVEGRRLFDLLMWMKHLGHAIYAESPYNWLNRPSAMDPLSDVLALFEPQSYVSGVFPLNEDLSIRFPKHAGIKFYAMIAGQCWLLMEGVAEPLHVSSGDCFVLPRGRPFCLTTDLSLEPVDFTAVQKTVKLQRVGASVEGNKMLMAGGHFVLTGNHVDVLLQSLPPIVHIQKESDKAAMRWSLERMSEELHNPQPGAALIVQQLAYMMLIQALRLHIASDPRHSGWLSALGDKQMSAAISCIHSDPGYPWTLQSLAERAGMSRSIFALRFKESVGVTPIEYVTRWRMTLAGDKLMNSNDSISEIAQSLGYESESAFGKAFRRVLGCSPRKYGRDERRRATDGSEQASSKGENLYGSGFASLVHPNSLESERQSNGNSCHRR